MALRLPVARDCTPAEARDPQDGQHEADDADRDPDPWDDEQEHEPDDDECEGYADHEHRVPAQGKPETSYAWRTTSRSSVISRIVYAGPSFVLPEPFTPP